MPMSSESLELTLTQGSSHDLEGITWNYLHMIYEQPCHLLKTAEVTKHEC